MLKPLRIALSFLTILPFGAGEVRPEDMERSVVFFPAAGLVIGALLTLVAWLGQLVDMGNLALAVVLVGCSAWLSRGLHLDGVADLCDGFGGSFEASRRLEIMKDSHIGAFGVVGLIMVLLFKVASLEQLLASPENLLTVGMVPVVARFTMLVTAFKARYPRQAGTGHFMVGRVSLSMLLGAAFFLTPLVLLAWQGLAILLACLVPALWLRMKANQTLGGVTGDVLGAAIEWSEAAGWLAAASLVGRAL
ncbi:MAG: adenosylcobinamide-GDP ribazoletransferase [Proteobacteria bacterium]|nr:adenosylcobinamide-GDP ribazoletransferase [Pseudomonadota bacterium]MBU1639068.1 adenosylcobinamide-GDP ribazoletransferase [Pseudomonadota bacterium]